MGAFLAYQPLEGHPDNTHAFESARSLFEGAKAMVAMGEAETATRVVKFARTHSPSSPIAVSQRGWLVSVGNWHHPSCAVRDDTAALLEQLEAQGPAVLDELDGGYVIAWYDGQSRTLTVVPDHLGRLHVYFVESDSGVYVSTSATALASAVPCKPDPSAVYELLAAGAIYEDRSPFDRVRRLQDTRRYFFRGGRLHKTERTTHLMVPRPGRVPGHSCLDDVVEAYHSAITRSLQGYERLIVDLTGGYDSRLLVGFLIQSGRQFDVTVSGASMHPDVRCAGKLAKSLGLKLIHEGPEILMPVKYSFPTVLRAAARVDGQYDAIEYASIGLVQERHAAHYDAGISAPGGEMWRSFWWNSDHLERPDIDPIPWVLPRFAGLAIAPQFLEPCYTLDPFKHFTGVLRRSLEGRSAYPPHDQLDHFYVGVRMQSWQGTIATATNEIWPNLSLHLQRRPLEKIFNVDPHKRLACHLPHEMFSRFGRAFANCPLARGYPPQDLRPLNAWRFAWSARGLPLRLWTVWREHQARKVGIDKRSAAIVRALFASGAADYLEPNNMALLPLCNRKKLEGFLDTARRTGEVPMALVGRLLSLEFALRRLSSSTKAAPVGAGGS
jgi:hypothetical protein